MIAEASLMKLVHFLSIDTQTKRSNQKRGEVGSLYYEQHDAAPIQLLKEL